LTSVRIVVTTGRIEVDNRGVQEALLALALIVERLGSPGPLTTSHVEEPRRPVRESVRAVP
jgi:hypothetical protein